MKHNFLLLIILAAIILVGCSSKEGVVSDVVSNNDNIKDSASDSNVEADSVSKGRILICDSSYLLISEQSGVTVLNSDDKSIFEGISIGDLVSVTHGVVMESYPGQTDAYDIELLEKGDIYDIESSVIEQLSDLGWVSNEIVVESDPPKSEGKTVKYEYEYANMQLTIPDELDWEYYIKEYSPTENSFGIEFYPASFPEKRIGLYCHNSVFTVCGTGLETEQIQISNFKATKGTYVPASPFSYITINGVAGDYVIHNKSTAYWTDEEIEDIYKILNTVDVAQGYPSEDTIRENTSSYNHNNYEIGHVWFDCINGIWEVYFVTPTGHPCHYEFSADGGIISNEYIIVD